MLLDLHAFVTANISVLISVSLILSVTSIVIVVLLIREVRFLRQPFRAMAELSDAKGT